MAATEAACPSAMAEKKATYSSIVSMNSRPKETGTSEGTAAAEVPSRDKEGTPSTQTLVEQVNEAESTQEHYGQVSSNNHNVAASPEATNNSGPTQEHYDEASSDANNNSGSTQEHYDEASLNNHNVEASSEANTNFGKCASHHAKCRSHFQFLSNLLRKKQLIPKTHLPKMTGLVCTCRKRYFHEELDHHLDMGNQEELLKALKSTITEKAKFCSSTSSDTEGEFGQICQALVKLSKVDDIDPLGFTRLLHVLSLAMDGHFDFFNYSQQPCSLVAAPSDTSKDNHLFVHAFEVEFDIRNLCFFIGKDGRNIQQFSQKHNCKIHVVDHCKRRFRAIGGDDNNVKIIVKAKQGCEAKEIEQEINTIMARIDETRKIYETRVLAFFEEKRKRIAARRARGKSMVAGGVTTCTATIRSKDEAKDCYATKYQHMLRDRSERQVEKQQPKPSMLQEGNSWCVNCLLPYDKDISNNEGQCIFHKGYLLLGTPLSKNRSWSCCWAACEGNKGCKTAEDMRSSHAASGCDKGRHIWKPHKRSGVTKGQLRSSQDKEIWKDAKKDVPAELLAKMILDEPE